MKQKEGLIKALLIAANLNYGHDHNIYGNNRLGRVRKNRKRSAPLVQRVTKSVAWEISRRMYPSHKINVPSRAVFN